MTKQEFFSKVRENLKTMFPGMPEPTDEVIAERPDALIANGYAKPCGDHVHLTPKGQVEREKLNREFFKGAELN